MFTHFDVQEAWLKAPPVLPNRLNVFEYPLEDLKGNEDSFQIFTAPIGAFSSDLDFWMAIVWRELEGRTDRYLTRGSVQDIPNHLYESEVRSLAAGTTKRPLPEELVFHGRPKEALKIRVDYCDEVILAILDDRYVAVRWYSSA